MNSAFSFDIDIDLTSILGPSPCANDMLLDSKWYEMAHPQSRRSEELQQKLDRALDSALYSLAKRAAQGEKRERRNAARVPIDLQLNIAGARPLRIKDLSATGLACIGAPSAPVMDIEFTLPGLKIPIESRAEVVRYDDSSSTPEVGLRFVQLDAPYREFILAYIADRDTTM